MLFRSRKNWEPICFVQANEGLQDNFPLKKVSNSPDTWVVDLPSVGNPIHESGFHPNGGFLCMMNNLRANNVAVFDTSDPDPRKWKRVTFVKDPEWQGEFPSPFHLNYSIDGSKCFFTVLRPKPMRSDVVVVDTRNDYEVEIGTFAGAINPDIQTFSQLPAWVEKAKSLQATHGRKPKVAMFCTGGIRCEKSTALMRTHGFDEVFHLQGGILKYLEQIPPDQSLWQGECFVFDERTSVGHGLVPGKLGICRS